jgi:murein DD-endopeptidase MepM/ murein hydrolase activator NlpD
LSEGDDYKWEVRAYGNGQWSGFSEDYYFQIEASAPPVPGLVSPGDDDPPGPTVSGTEQTFEWESVSEAERYGLYVKNESTGDLVVDDDYVYSTSQTETLSEGDEYKWEVRAYGNGQWSSFSEDYYFQIEAVAPSPPTAESPGNADSDNPEVVETLTPTFQWTEVSGADKYGLYISKYPYGSSNLVYENETPTGESFSIPSGELEAGTRYRWNMVSVKNGKESDVSNTLYFRTGESGSKEPNLIVEDVSFGSSSVTAGDDISVSFTIRNIGDGRAGFTFSRLRLSTDEQLTENDEPLSPKDVDIPAIEAGGSHDVGNLERTVPSSTPVGKYYVGVFADAGFELDQPTEDDVGLSESRLRITADDESPVADKFDYPVGPGGELGETKEDPDSWYVARGFLDESGKGYHLGEDWNHEEDRDSDCGNQIYATAAGTVIHAQDEGAEWGNVVIIRHKLPNGERVESLYGHLQSIGDGVQKGETVSLRQSIGLLGDGNGDGDDNDDDYCHLHFEVRNTSSSDWGNVGHAYVDNQESATGWVDPSDFVDDHSDNSAGACPSDPPVGENPSLTEISNCIDQLAQKYKVPGLIVRGLLQQESIEWKQFCDADVSDRSPCKDHQNGAPVVSSDDGRGLTQVTIKDENISGGEADLLLARIGSGNQGRNSFTIELYKKSVIVSKLENNWRFNLEKGVQRLLAKKAGKPKPGTGEPGSNNKILENWYNALAYYNGYSSYKRSEYPTESSYCPKDPEEPIGRKCGNDPGYPYIRNGTRHGWTDKQIFPYQEATFNTVSQQYSIVNRQDKGFPDEGIKVTLPGPAAVSSNEAGGYSYVWRDYSRDYEENIDSKWLDFYVDENQGYARKSTDCVGNTFEATSDCDWSTSVPVSVHRVESFSDHVATSIGSSGQQITLSPGRDQISFSKEPDASTMAEVLTGNQASATRKSQASASSIFEYVFWLGEDGTVEYGHINEVDPKAKRGYFVFVEGDESVTIDYSGSSVDPALSLHRTMNMAGPTEQATFAPNDHVYPDAIYIDENGEPKFVDPQSEALSPGTAYFLPADEETTFSPTSASSSANTHAAAVSDTMGQHARREKVEHLLDRVNAKLARLRDDSTSTEALQTASASAKASPTCETDGTSAFAVCFQVEQEIPNGDPHTVKLVAGTQSEATSGWKDDSDLLQANFSAPGLPHAYIDEGYGLQKSMKSSGDTEKTWPLLVTSASRSPTYGDNTNSVRLSWSIPQLPDQKQVQLLDENGSVLVDNMTEQTELSRSVSDPGTQWRFKIRLTEAESVARTLSVNSGWNMASMPVKGEAKGLGAALPEDCGTRFRWRPGQGLYQEFSSGEGLSPGQGAWTFCESGATVEVTGQPVATSKKTVQVEAGWNQVGPFEEAVAPSDVAQNPGGILEAGTWFRWDPQQGRYAEPTSLEPGAGYWVFATEGGTLDFSGAGSAAATASAGAAEAQANGEASTSEAPEGALKLHVTEEGGHEATLYLAPDLTEEERKRWRLPPVGPGGAFDVRFAGGFQAAQAGGSSSETGQAGRREGPLLRVRGAEDPVTLRLGASKPSSKAPGQELESRSIRVVDAATGGKQVEARLTGESPAATVPARIERLRVQVEEVPEKITLRKPYPSPARRQATVEYSLPEQREVRIAVYDVLGRRVETVTDRKRGAGTYRATLETDRLPSGTYFVRMQAGSFQKTRRLTVVK